MVITSHKWDECHSNPKNANKPEAKKYLAKKQLASDKKNKGFTNSTTEIAKLKAQVAAQQALLEVKANKGNSHQNDKATLAEIMQYDNLDEKEAALEELVLSLHALSVNGGANVTDCYTIADAQATPLQQPIIDSGASMIFVTNSDDLTNPTKHKTKINTANGQTCFTKDMGKYKVTNGKTPIYVTAFSAPAFIQNLISAGQLANNKNVVFNKSTC